MGNSVLFHKTAEVELKLVPLTVNVNAAPPTVAEVGDTLVNVGMLDGVPMVKMMVFETRPFGF